MTIQEAKQRFGIVGTSPALDRALFKAIQVAATDISVLVTGESGVGKEAIPKIIHSLSHRKHKPLVPVNCGAIPEGTIDSELFGHEKGSFTGATGARKGYFEEADGGTVFLDEVGELPLGTQVRLLRVLETGEYIRVGSSKPQSTNVRVVGATNVNMFSAIERNKFREDLYYRLNTVEIHLPPLRERKEDIHLLFRKFAQDFSQKYRLPAVRLAPDAVMALEQYRWPGNIRQLRNLAEQLSVVETDREVSAETLMNYIPEIAQSHLPVRSSDGPLSQSEFNTEREILYKVLFDMRNDLNNLRQMVNSLAGSSSGEEGLARVAPSVRGAGNAVGPGISSAVPAVGSVALEPVERLAPNERYIEAVEEAHEEDHRLSLYDLEAEMVRKALDRHKGRRKEAAAELGISERTLYRKIKQLDL
jgi:transcriptional regulator with PAS, ATPase and Fis domain